MNVPQQALRPHPKCKSGRLWAAAPLCEEPLGPAISRTTEQSGAGALGNSGTLSPRRPATAVPDATDHTGSTSGLCTPPPSSPPTTPQVNHHPAATRISSGHLTGANDTRRRDVVGAATVSGGELRRLERRLVVRSAARVRCSASHIVTGTMDSGVSTCGLDARCSKGRRSGQKSSRAHRVEYSVHPDKPR